MRELSCQKFSQILHKSENIIFSLNIVHFFLSWKKATEVFMGVRKIEYKNTSIVSGKSEIFIDQLSTNVNK